MPKYVMWGNLLCGCAGKTRSLSSAHLAGLCSKRNWCLITIGPTKDVTKVFGIYEAETEASVRQLIEADPIGNMASGQNMVCTSGFKLFEVGLLFQL